jgi:hypothetical protein
MVHLGTVEDLLEVIDLASHASVQVGLGGFDVEVEEGSEVHQQGCSLFHSFSLGEMSGKQY